MFAKECVPLPDSNSSLTHEILDNDIKMCTSWNTFQKNGCQYEFLNPGKYCKFGHYCSLCRANGIDFMPHKALEFTEYNDHFCMSDHPSDSPETFDQSFSDEY